MDRSGGILMAEEILQQAIVDQDPQDKAKCIVNMKGIPFSEIHTLHLEYRDILMIDHLWEFTSLARLDMHNNLIENIEGLDCLINLTWLDLSFNHIKKIEGLESLWKLEGLILSNNKISVLENMDTLERLTHFSIANNLLGQLDNVLYLRKFKKLFNINLFGNPCTKEGDYKLFIAAYFPDLRCLNFRLLDEKTRKEASIKYHYVLEKMKRDELQMQQADKAEQRKKAEVKLHTDAFVEFLNGSQLFKSMFKDDPEADKLHCVPEMAHLLQTFEQRMVELCMQLFEIGLAEHKRREIEVNSFFSGQNKTVTKYQQQASQILANFEQQHKERIVDMQKLSDPDLLKVKINHCTDEIKQLSKSLMVLEFQMVSQLEDIINKLDISLSDMVGNFTETVQGIFAQCRDLEDDHYGKVQVTALAILGNVSKDNLDEDLQDDVKMLFTDKDTVMDALATGHDNHLMKINDRETQLVTRADAWKVALVKGIQDKELKRNRIRISDIHRYEDHLSGQLKELQ